MTQDNLFTETPSQVTAIDATISNAERDYLGELVGEGKKFKSPIDLAKGKVEADTFIERLKEENRTLREDLQTRQKLSELIDNLAHTTPASSENTYQDSSQFNPEDLDTILEQKLNERDLQRKRTENIQYVKETLKAQYGEGYIAKLKEVTEQLGLPAQAVNQLASNSPQAVLKLFGSVAPPPLPPSTRITPPTSSVNIPVTTQVNTERNQAYYDKIKTSDKARYWSSEVQSQMHTDAIRLGDKFFNE